jgi:hypothetical protein
MTNVAQAAFVLTVDDLSTAGLDVVVSDGLGIGATTASGLVTTVADGGIGPDGAIFFNGGVGSFVVNVVTGVSDPIIGPGQMDLNSINVTGGSSGTLVIGLTDTDYTGAASAYSTNFGGTTTGSVDFNFLYDAGNGEFGGTSFFNPGAASGGAFSGSSTDAVIAGSPYSLTILAQISHSAGAGQISSFDAHLVPVPVPAAVWLFGSGLLGLAGIARRKA